MNTERALPNPQVDLSFPLMKALELRRTTRKWKNTEISEQELSNLLWAACGITSQGTKTTKSRRTAPSAANCQEIRVYVALKDGLYIYEEKTHALVKKLDIDIRENIGTQRMMRSTPVGIIYVADYSKMKSYLAKDDNRKLLVSGTDTGFISQNIYLYCAAAKLSTAMIGLVNRDLLHTTMKLGTSERVVYTQVVGHAI